MRFILAVALLLQWPCVQALAQAPAAAREAAAEYVCPMAEHPQVFQKPGTCPLCGMRLVDRKKLIAEHKSVAILVFDGVQIIDYAAPYEVFGQVHFNVFTVGPTKDSITTAMGQKLTPSYGLADAPPADIVVLPGGDLKLEDTRIVDWIRAREAGAEVMLSVCNGAFWLAKAGLLDGLTVTTFHRAIDDLVAAAPKARVVRDQRFVDNGKIVTSAGLTAGLDGSLHVVEKLLGRDRARATALHLEYDWHPESKYARANLADRYLPQLELGDDVAFELVSSLGDLDHWMVEGKIESQVPVAVLLGRLGNQLESRAHWKREVGPRAADLTQAWSFIDEQGRRWRAVLSLAAGSASGLWKTTLALEQV